MDRKKIYYCDVDGTVCTNTNGKYWEAKPFISRIQRMNSLYDKGHTIIYWTARGATTHKDWRKLTEYQLKSWGVKYHKLVFGKYYYDKFICDKAINTKDFFKRRIKWN